MFVRMLQKVVSNTKELQDIGLFAAMVDSRWFAFFNGSPFFFVMLPFIAVLLTVSAVINGFQLAAASNKNFDKWFGFVISGICAMCASVSLYGAVISTALELSFAAGPWFFFASVLLAVVHQAVMLGLNAFRAYESAANSSQRLHYIQAILNNLFVLSLLTVVLGAVTFVMLTPAAPLIGSICALAAVVLTAANLLWRITPQDWKHSLKKLLRLEKNEVGELHLNPPKSSQMVVPDLNSTLQPMYQPLFAARNYSEQIKEQSVSDAETHLKQVIANKIARLTSNLNSDNTKNSQKVTLLRSLVTAFENKDVMDKKEFLTKHPLAFQSFWTEKGEVEQIFDAMVALQEKQNDSVSQNPGPITQP